MKKAKLSVYVVTAFEEERVKEQKVIEGMEDAYALRKKWIDLYGGANVCIASRDLLVSVPQLIN